MINCPIEIQKTKIKITYNLLEANGFFKFKCIKQKNKSQSANIPDSISQRVVDVNIQLKKIRNEYAKILSTVKLHQRENQ